MLTAIGAFSGMSVLDVDEAAAYWRRVGVEVEDGPIARLHLPGGQAVILYGKPDHAPATFTVLNLVVPHVGEAIRELAALGIEPVRHPGVPHDEDGAMRGRGPDIAWFEDPSGNIWSVIAG